MFLWSLFANEKYLKVFRYSLSKKKDKSVYNLAANMEGPLKNETELRENLGTSFLF